MNLIAHESGFLTLKINHSCSLLSDELFKDGVVGLVTSHPTGYKKVVICGGCPSPDQNAMQALDTALKGKDVSGVVWVDALGTSSLVEEEFPETRELFFFHSLTDARKTELLWPLISPHWLNMTKRAKEIRIQIEQETKMTSSWKDFFPVVNVFQDVGSASAQLFGLSPIRATKDGMRMVAAVNFEGRAGVLFTNKLQFPFRLVVGSMAVKADLQRLRQTVRTATELVEEDRWRNILVRFEGDKADSTIQVKGGRWRISSHLKPLLSDLSMHYQSLCEHGRLVRA